MSSLVLAARAAADRSILAELIDRQRTLAIFGFATLFLALPAIAMIPADPRTLAGVSVWVKPAKFLVSIGIFSLTAAWYYGYVAPEGRQSRALRWSVQAIVWSGTFELLYIGYQASQGAASHFNTGTAFHAIMYGLMGVSAVILIATTLPLAAAIVRRPADGLSRDFVAAVAIGLVLTFLLGGGLGGYMSSQPGHSVGPEGGGFPIFGWNRLGGDLRVAHFLGIHAEQALPILAALVASWGVRERWTALGLGTLLYVALTLAVFAQAVAGSAFLAF